MAPFARDPVPAYDYAPANYETAAHPGSENHTKHRFNVLGSAINHFGQREAIGVILKPYRTIQDARNVAVQWLAV